MRLIAKIIIVAAVFFAGFYFGQKQLGSDFLINTNINTNQANQAVTDQKKTVSLMLDFGNGEIKTFKDIAIEEKTNLFDLLKKVTSENNLEFRYKDYGGDLGVLIESINNIGNNVGSDRFWQYWVNNEYAKIGASNYKLNPGDLIEWKYIKGQFNN